MSQINTVIIGIAGRMGLSNYHLLSQLDEVRIIGGIESEASPFIGKKIEELTPSGSIHHSHSFTINKNLEEVKEEIDLIIDFSKVESTLKHLANLEELKIKKPGWIIGTTGFSQNQVQSIKQYAKQFPIVISGNFSTGINLLLNLIKSATHSLGDEFDLEVVEHHHREKIDAPSGTAQMILEVILKEKKLSQEAVINGRDGLIGKRGKKEVGVSVLRGGGVIGQHEVHFLGDQEKLLISHTALNRNAFTSGVKRAAIFVREKIRCKEVGLFNMQDVLNFRQ